MWSRCSDQRDGAIRSVALIHLRKEPSRGKSLIWYPARSTGAVCSRGPQNTPDCENTLGWRMLNFSTVYILHPPASKQRYLTYSTDCSTAAAASCSVLPPSLPAPQSLIYSMVYSYEFPPPLLYKTYSMVVLSFVCSLASNFLPFDIPSDDILYFSCVDYKLIPLSLCSFK